MATAESNLMEKHFEAMLAPMVERAVSAQVVKALRSIQVHSEYIPPVYVEGAMDPIKYHRISRKTARDGFKRPYPKAGAQPCAIDGCERPNRCKGYCSSHYQKFRMLAKTKRLPKTWVEDAKPGTVQDLKLVRGRKAKK